MRNFITIADSVEIKVNSLATNLTIDSLVKVEKELSALIKINWGAIPNSKINWDAMSNSKINRITMSNSKINLEPIDREKAIDWKNQQLSLSKIRLEGLKKSIISILRTYDYSRYKLNSIFENIESINFRLKNIDIPDKFSISELFKRIFLGVIVVSFFIAILRFTIGQYTNNFNQYILADEEISSIRRFYVAYKSSETEKEKAAAIMKLIDLKNAKEITKASEIKLMDNNMLKDILVKIADKI